ncbi:MAG: class I SAM-dependent methyltransferase [Clostridiales bacterium]|nr:class I SAM-dependent methyltransferase [Clostridiales bacterium]
MSQRIKIVNAIYTNIDEDTRLDRSRHGQMEYITTMEYIHRYASKGDKILEIGAGTGRYSVTLAKEGYNTTAIELVEHNLDILKAKSVGLKNLQAYQGDALDLSRFRDGAFDITLVLGPMYHLYDKNDVSKAINEAIRVTKKRGIVLVAFLSVYSVLFDYFNGRFVEGIEENFTNDYFVKHFEEQLFTGYDIVEFERLFNDKQVDYLSTVAADSILELAERGKDFVMTDDEFKAFTKYHLATCEKRELLGCSSHLLYICRKK